jgi:hypothetical protein
MSTRQASAFRDTDTATIPGASPAAPAKTALRQRAYGHAVAAHPLFAQLAAIEPTRAQAGAFLRNYDAHASVLRRLLLSAATVMPEEAVGYVLENVRNEYGNGDPDRRHQLQLFDLAERAGVPASQLQSCEIQPGVRRFIDKVGAFYAPPESSHADPLGRAAIAAGAITATELLAVREFECMQMAFGKLGLANHIWFDHVVVEAEHSDESLALALHFIERHGLTAEVEAGLDGMLALNGDLYDGLASALAV